MTTQTIYDLRFTIYDLRFIIFIGLVFIFFEKKSFQKIKNFFEKNYFSKNFLKYFLQKKIGLSLFFVGSAIVFLVAQNPVTPEIQNPTDTNKVQILSAQVLTFTLLKDEQVRKLIGNVRLKHKDAIMFCDSAVLDNANNVIARGGVVIKQGDSVNVFSDSLHYFGNTRQADLFGDVILKDNDKKLFTTKLHYDLANKVATYIVPATLDDGKSQLTSRRGEYRVVQHESFFKDHVVVVGKDVQIKTDTLRYNTQTNVAYFLAPALFYLKDSARFYTEAGFYDLDKDKAEFTLKPQYEKKSQIATADTMLYDGVTSLLTLKGNAVTHDSVRNATANTIIYNRKTEETFLQGNAFFKDTSQTVKSDTILYDTKAKTYRTRGRTNIVNGKQLIEADIIDFESKDSVGVARGNVYWQDTSAKTTLRCQTMQYDQKRDYIKAFGKRPILSSLVEKDTLFMRADTIITFKETAKDTARTLLGFEHVRIFKKNFQAVCDSMAYVQKDSAFRLFRDPLVWSDTAQLSGDTIRVSMRERKIDKVFLDQNAFIINSRDEHFFNEIKGRHVTAFFEQDSLRRIFVEGNAESLYYVTDDKNAYVSVNKIECSEMLIYLDRNKIDKIKFFKKPKGNMIPMKQADHDGLKLKGFKWQSVRRPKNKDDL